ncbi:uncharacterized protein PAC_09850 [Phialocephala subalpina]|uniref:Uncharacterized protein n=1 Tax=Phialocephala subalpina TaxID=576137 RepID=A0A1L7X4K4_9HELO|nr:uncharacterized protein PAC_09850 [Phialocephala subalpina]
MSSDGNAISSFANNAFHPLYPRSSGLSHRATITVVVLCSVFGFLLFMFLWLCCCIRSRRRASASYSPHELAEEGSEFTGSSFGPQSSPRASFRPNQLWTPTQAERDLEYVASQGYQGWAIGRDILRSEQNLTATELVTEPPRRVSEASPSSSLLPAPQFPLPMSIREPPQSSIPNEEQPTLPSATFTQPPALTCCNNTFRTRAEYKYAPLPLKVTPPSDPLIADIEDTTTNQRLVHIVKEALGQREMLIAMSIRYTKWQRSGFVWKLLASILERPEERASHERTTGEGI